MNDSAPRRPTEAEIDILRILWRRGPCSVKEVHEEIRRLRTARREDIGRTAGREISDRAAHRHPVTRTTRLTTTLKQMQLMTGKGLLKRDEARRPHLYRPQVPQERTLRQLASSLLERAFGGSAERLVMHALEAGKVSREELDRIRKLLDNLEEGQR